MKEVESCTSSLLQPTRMSPPDLACSVYVPEETTLHMSNLLASACRQRCRAVVADYDDDAVRHPPLRRHPPGHLRDDGHCLPSSPCPRPAVTDEATPNDIDEGRRVIQLVNFIQLKDGCRPQGHYLPAYVPRRPYFPSVQLISLFAYPSPTQSFTRSTRSEPRLVSVTRTLRVTGKQVLLASSG